MTSPLDRQAPCPNCGAPMTFKFAGARAQVCQHCKFVVARTDLGLAAQGRMADLIEIPTPLRVGVTGYWGADPFCVEGRVQMDRAGAPGAPWQEILLSFPAKGTSAWVAYAQGRWYATSEQALPPGGVPPLEYLRPGGTVDLGPHGHWVVAEVGQRRVVSGEGELSSVPAPGAITRYADISAAGGRFGTIDYGDGRAPPELYLGQQFDPAALKLESGLPLEAPEAKVTAVDCPNCGGNLPLLSQQSERVVCQYCGTASDLSAGKLSALGPSPRPPIQPYLPIGSQGLLRGCQVVVVGFLIRSCVVEGERYDWREYLLFGGERVGYQWLIEQDGGWQHVVPIEVGEILDSGGSVIFRGGQYYFKEAPVTATVDYVLGEFYWKVEIGERVEATELEGPGGKVSREVAPTEVTYSFCSPLPAAELGQAFGIAAPPGATTGAGGFLGGCANIIGTIVVVIVICIVIALFIGGVGDGDGGYSGSGSSGSWGGK
ncbi:MAG: DUF4178 domain-containing protein [Deltaproteobacteria bacterium]|nr:DUF4178 domain-containing protein [Deltaproteobacteria bacterium]